jgi:subtilisin family serine protease
MGALSSKGSDLGEVLAEPGLITEETIVRLPDAQSFEKALEIGSYMGSPIINAYAPLRILRLEYPIRNALSGGMFQRQCLANSVDISPNYIRRAHLLPDDPKLSKQTYLNPIGAKEGWDLFYGDSSVIIALIDTGIDINHPDLLTNVVGGINLRAGEDPSDIDDPHGHGTAVAGVIGATTDNGIGIAGMCWKVNLLPIKVLGGDELTTTLFEEAAAIDYAVSHGAKVINMSFGGPGTSSVELAAIHNAWQKGAILVSSAGNDGEYGDHETAPDGLNYPAAFEEVIGVGALEFLLQKAEFSNYGQDQCEFVAIGVSVYTTLPGGLGEIEGPVLIGRNYGWANGTSLAAPQVTALAALLRMKEPGLSAAEVRQRLRDNADSFNGPDADGDGVDDNLGYGLIQCRNALADSPVGRNDALKAGVFASPIFPEKIYVYVQNLRPIDANSLAVTAIPESGPATPFAMTELQAAGWLGSIISQPSGGPVEIEIRASSGSTDYPVLVIKYNP